MDTTLVDRHGTLKMLHLEDQLLLEAQLVQTRLTIQPQADYNSNPKIFFYFLILKSRNETFPYRRLTRPRRLIAPKG